MASSPSSSWDATLLGPRTQLRETPDGARLFRDSRLIKTWRDPLDALAWLPRSWEDLGLPETERWKGFLSYDLGRRFERLPTRARDVIRAPLFQFGIEPSGRLPGSERHQRPPAELYRLRSSFARDEYLRAVERSLEYVRAGDVFQVNLSQVFTVAFDRHASTVFARLNAAAPAVYGAYLNFGEIDLVSNSPELFLRVTPDRRVVTRPIKGTRPRLPGMGEELLASAKDAAELNMIIDLERNDLGRVCEIGSVKVTQPRTIEEHPTVYHGVATVEGVLREDVGFVDLLRATFPGGSVTGAPKIRAMEIIEELEPVRRGPYCGAIGYLAQDGSMQFNVAIRTMTFKDGLVHVPVGGGIVADSDPAAEYEETLVKARAMFDALGVPREAYDR
jgi:anthranilate/para-aminobenzoate synthase component I